MYIDVFSCVKEPWLLRMYIVLASSRLYSHWRQAITEDDDDDDEGRVGPSDLTKCRVDPDSYQIAQRQSAVKSLTLTITLKVIEKQ